MIEQINAILGQNYTIVKDYIYNNIEGDYCVTITGLGAMQCPNCYAIYVSRDNEIVAQSVGVSQENLTKEVKAICLSVGIQYQTE